MSIISNPIFFYGFPINVPEGKVGDLNELLSIYHPNVQVAPFASNYEHIGKLTVQLFAYDEDSCVRVDKTAKFKEGFVNMSNIVTFVDHVSISEHTMAYLASFDWIEIDGNLSWWLAFSVLGN